MFKLAVYAICKNEITNIASWLESVKEADYICILDTGSTDGTYEFLCRRPNIILKQEIIEPFRFDIARNKSLELVPGDADICLPLDLDMRLSKGFVLTAKRTWQSSYAKSLVSQYYTTTGRAAIWSMHARKAEWKYPVYEQLSVEGEVGRCVGAIILHNWDIRKESHKLYPELAELGVKENPANAYCYKVRAEISKEISENF